MSSHIELMQHPVLYFNPRSPRGLRPSQRRYLLWPALAYRVVAPVAGRRRVNILEKAVLGLHRAGVHCVEDVGRNLLLAPQLAAHIGAQMIEQGYLGRDGRLTRRGEDLLDLETQADGDLTQGFVFQDPWTGKLWPRFKERFSCAEVRREDASHTPEGSQPRLSLMLGTTGKPDPKRVFYVQRPDTTAVAQPQIAEVLRAVRQQRRKERQNDPLANEDGDIEQRDDAPGNTPAMSRVAFVEERPRPVWLTTFVFVSEDTQAGAGWLVCDPFGFGLSNDLAQWISREMKGSEPLHRLVLRLLGEQAVSREADYAAHIEGLRQLATLEVQLRVGSACGDAELFELLEAMERSRQEVRQLGESCLPDKLDDVLGKSQEALERFFTILAVRNPTRGCASGLARDDTRFNANLLDRLARQLGVTDPLPPGLANVRSGKVYWAAQNSTGSLRPRLLAALLAASRQPVHPLRAALRSQPRLLHDLDRLAQLRDEAQHAMSNRTRLTLSLIEENTELVYEVVRLLTESPPAVSPA